MKWAKVFHDAGARYVVGLPPSIMRALPLWPEFHSQSKTPAPQTVSMPRGI